MGSGGRALNLGRAARPSDMTDRGQRSREAALPAPEGQGRCDVCLKLVPIKKNGLLRGHQARKGISCAGGNPTDGTPATR